MIWMQGEPGTWSLQKALGAELTAVAAFKKKFKDKTKHDWDNRANFVPSPGKYTLLEMDEDDEDGEEVGTTGGRRRWVRRGAGGGGYDGGSSEGDIIGGVRGGYDRGQGRGDMTGAGQRRV